jgi:hypothetical protein
MQGLGEAAVVQRGSSVLAVSSTGAVAGAGGRTALVSPGWLAAAGGWTWKNQWLKA